MNKRIFRVGPWLVALALVGALVVGVSWADSVTSDPDWAGITPENVSQQDGYHRGWQPDITIASSEVVVVWSDKASSDAIRDIFYRKRSGDSWSSAKIISDTQEISSYPDVVSVDGRHFVAWVDLDEAVYEVELGKDVVREVPSALSPTSRSWARLVGGEDRLHIIFGAGSGGVPDIYHASRELTATSWPQADLVYSSGSSALWPDLALSPDGRSLHLVWQEGSSIKYMSGDVGASNVSWSTDETISGDSDAVNPKVTVDVAGDVHVAWAEKVSSEQDVQRYYIRYRRLEAGAWSDPVRVDYEPVRSNPDIPLLVAPSLTMSERGGRVRLCVAWYGFRENDPKVEEVLLRCSQDGGLTWAGETMNVSRMATEEGSEISMRPSIASDASGRIHAVWQEHVEGDLKSDYEVYYAHELSQVFLPLVLRSYR